MGKREKMTEERKRSDSQCCATRRKNAPELCPPLQKKRNRKKNPNHIKHLSFQKFMMTLYRAVFHRSSEDLFMATLNFYPVGK